tara:strand:+ start:289 stop:504 length:216 start_codon:yes stop_codon:yes gene_type:complete
MEAIVLVLGVLFLVCSALTYVYLIETKKLKPHIPPRYKHEQAQRGNFWDAESQQFYKWDKLMELQKIRGKK